MEGHRGVDGVARYVYLFSPLLRMEKLVELAAEGFWLRAAIFTMITFAVVTDQYRTSRYAGFLYARYGQYKLLIVLTQITRVLILATHRAILLREHCRVGSSDIGNFWRNHHGNLLRQGPPLGCRKSLLRSH